MGEIKSVKVDNWGVFFLQKLQNFFNKTDYCDLTLQFRDNSQLKVHRLVLSACTDYFNVLEQTCDVVDDALLMPDELQADVVVPIVNFMYTGTLEFELKMYGKLLRTAKEMNMTVLLKLLEAHRRTMEGVNRAQRPPSPKPIRRRQITGGASVPSPQQAQQQQRRVLTSANVTQTPNQRAPVHAKSIATNSTQQSVPYRQQIGSTSLLRTSAGGTQIIRSQYGTTSIYSTSNQQQQAKHEDQHSSSVKQQQQPTSPFEQLRKGYNNNKRPAPTTFVSPPTKKPNIEDVKEFAEQQRMRKQIAAEYGDDPEYEGMLDDDIHNDDDDDDGALASSSASAVPSTSKQSPSTQGGTTVTFRQELNDKPPTIVVKDSSNSKMNHAKIISEVLRQYPHLVKGNKNIKLKIMPNVGGQSQKIIVKKESIDGGEAGGGQQQNLPGAKVQPSARPADKVIIQKTTQQQTQTVSKDVVSTPMSTSAAVFGASASSAAKASSADNASAVPAQKRRIDSKTMHALISLGAENTTGPWLCLRCGVNGRPISIPSYRGFRRHLINTHKESIDPALCEHCGWRSNTNRELHFHMQLEHKVRTTLYTFPECLMCAELFLDTNALNQHMIDSHPDESKQKCIYCNKIFAKEIQLYTHMKTFHKKQALDDGIIDYSDDEFTGSQDEIDEIQNKSTGSDKKEGKIKILSDISLPSAGTLLKLEPSSEAAALSTVASGIAASIGISHAEEFMETQAQGAEAGTEPKFVNADGNEMLLTEEQRKEIMSQLNDGEGGNASGGVLMVINETSFGSATESGATADGNAATAATVLAGNEESETADNQTENTTTGEGSATEEEYDDSQIFNELTSQTNASITEEEEDEDEEEAQSADKKNASPAVDDSKESIDENLEWAEKLISAHEKEESAAEADEQKVAEDKAKKADDISKKLKELTGDWSDDENEDDMEAEAEADNSYDAEVSAEMDADTEDNAIKICTQSNEDKPNAEAANSEKDVSSDVVAQKPVSTEEPSIDEDDIDMAMQSLHKDEMDTDESVAKKSDEVASERSESESAATNINRSDVKEESKEEEQIRVHPPEIKKEKESSKCAKNEQERDDASTSLLDDLISDADLSRVDEDAEFISVKSEVISPERKPTTSAMQKANESLNEDTPATEKEMDVTEMDEAVPLQNVETKSNTIEEENKEHYKDDEDNDDGDGVSDKKETDKRADAIADTHTETPTNAAHAEDVKVQDAEIIANAPTEATKTEDKVKSLISEWGDEDEEDDGEGNENIASADEL